jgi:tetratricopeptide (TPR) repeat protein
MKHYILFLFISTFSFAQQSGYWDNQRATSKEVSLSAGKRVLIKSEDLPIGTTEFVYRITLLNDSQKLSNSLASILKAIPDPTGISQGAAGAVFLTSSITGDDKCKYALFSNAEGANAYLKDANLDLACLVQKEKVNKEAKLIALKNSKCLDNIPYLWFGFESQNWVMNQKIVLEIVPWVDNVASRGWNSEAKNNIISLAKKFLVSANLKNKEAFYANFLELVSSKYTYTEFNNLLPIEKNKVIELFTEESLKKSGEVNVFYDILRDKSFKEFNKGNYKEAINILQVEVFNKNRATYKDYGILGDYYLFSKQFTKAEETYTKGLQLQPSEINFYLNLAHVYLFTDRISEAKELHKKYKHENLFTGNSWVKQVQVDFKEFEKHRLPNENFKKILRILD